MYCRILLLFFLLSPTISNGANLLMISPSLSRSLMLHMGRLADLLVLAGHNVTIWIPEMEEIPESGSRLAQHVVRTSGLTNPVNAIRGMDVLDEQVDTFAARLALDNSMVEYCESILKNKEKLEVLRDSQFDLAFTNMIDLCMPGLVHYLGIQRHIWVSTGPLPDAYHWLLGIPQPLSALPTFQQTILLGPKMTAWERALNIWQYSLSWISLNSLFRQENALFRKYISSDFPALEEITSKTDLAFVNVDEFLEPAMATLPKAIPIGGLGLMMHVTGQLNPKIQNALESGQKGAVLVSLGSITNTQSLNPVKWGNLLAAFSQHPDYAFLVKISHGDAFSKNATAKMENVHLFEWLPQTELLSHPNIRLLISHAGYNSILESTIHGVPILAIPLFFDQHRNAKCAEHRGHTRVLSKRDLLDQEKIRAEIGEMLENPSYKKAALRLAKLFHEKPNRPEHSLLSWTEFVLANGPLVEMVPGSVGMTLVEYFCLDIALYFLAIATAVLWLVWKTMGIVFGCFKRNKQQQQKRKCD